MIPEAVLVSGSLFLSYGIESIFGFAGSVLALTLISFFIDIKTAVAILPFAAIIASSFVLATDRKAPSVKVCLKVLSFSLPGLLGGVFLLAKAQSEVLVKLLGGLLALYAIWLLINPSGRIPKIVRYISYPFAGLVMGMFGIGAFYVIGIRDEIGDKRVLRGSLALMWLLLGLLRIPLYISVGVSDYSFLSYSWLFLPSILAAVLLGFHIHKKIQQQKFSRLFSLILFLVLFYYFFH